MPISIAQPFPIIAYQFSPISAYINVPLTVEVVPNVSAATYSITSGALPPGLTLNALTGAITGTPSMLMINNVVSITGTFLDSTTYTVKLPFSILNIPVTAQLSNAASQNGLLAISEYHTNIFIADVNTQIAQANAQGKFQIFADLPYVCNFNSILSYFGGLNYSVQRVNWRNRDLNYQWNSPWLGEFYSFGEFPSCWGLEGTGQLTRPGYPVIQQNSNRVLIDGPPIQLVYTLRITTKN